MQNKSKIKYFVYARKSSENEDRQIQSIESQVIRLQEIARNLKLDIKDVFTEAKSAKMPHNRPVFKKMMDKIENGEAEGILCWQINRLSRNPVDSGRIGWLLQQGILKSIQTIDKQYLPEDNVLIFNVESGVATQFILELSRNVKRGIKAQAERGWRPGATAHGYKWYRTGEKSVIKKDKKRFFLVRKMWDLMLQGTYTPGQILKIANNKWGYRTRKAKKLGGNPISRSAIYNIFRDPFYCGEFEYPKGSNNWYEGKHKQMISKEEFDKVQVLLGRKGNPRPQKHKFAFTGMMKCSECGCSITAEIKNQLICSACKNKFAYKNRNSCPNCKTLIVEMKNPKILKYIYYHCTKRKNPNCSQGSIEVKKLEKQIDKYLSKISVKADYAKFAIEYLNKNNEKEIKDRNNIMKTRQAAYNRCQAQIDGLLKNYISPENTDYSLISAAELKKQKTKLLQEKARLKQSIKETDNRAEEWMELTEKTFNFCTYARYWLKHGSLEQKKQILFALGSNPLLKNGKLKIHLYDQWNLIKNALAAVPKAKAMFEPVKIGLNKTKTANITADCPAWYARQDSNLRPSA